MDSLHWVARDLSPDAGHLTIDTAAQDEILRLADVLRANPLPTEALLPGDFDLPRCRALMAHALTTLASRGTRTLIVQSDPNSAPFYRACGGRLIGERPSGSIPGRSLPLLAFDVEEAAPE